MPLAMLEEAISTFYSVSEHMTTKDRALTLSCQGNLRTKFACDEFLSCCFIQGLMSQVATACYHHPPMILLQYS